MRVCECERERERDRVGERANRPGRYAEHGGEKKGGVLGGCALHACTYFEHGGRGRGAKRRGAKRRRTLVGGGGTRRGNVRLAGVDVGNRRA